MPSIYPALLMKGLIKHKVFLPCKKERQTGVPLFQNNVRTNQEAVRGVRTSQREEPVACETIAGRNSGDSTGRRRESATADRLDPAGHRGDGKSGQAGDRGQADRTGRHTGGGGAVRGHSVAGVLRHSLSTLFLEARFRFVAPVGCPDCSSVAFCGRRCRDVAVASYHKYECKILALLIGSGMSVLSMLALRMTTQAGPAGCMRIHRALNRSSSVASNEQEQQQQQQQQQVERSSSQPKLSKSAKRRLRRKKLGDSRHRLPSNERESPQHGNQARETEEKLEGEDDPSVTDLRVYRLITHEKRRTARDFFERSLMAAFLLKCLQRVGFFEGATKDGEAPNDREIAVAALLLRHLQLLQFNAHEVFETRLGREHQFRGSRPVYVGVAIYPTVARFNHDCYPAVTRYFVGRSIVIRATRSLRPGDVVAENYGPIFTKQSLHERQRTLAGRYWFRCECTACREDWPRFETLTNDIVRLRCPTEGCLKLHRPPTAESDGSIVCSSCRRRVHLRERLERVRECERLYAEGIDVMEQHEPERALNLLLEAAAKFHRIASPPHKDTHLAEIAASACMAQEGNVYRPEISP
ncbi:SET and MYND domain-containing protein 4-like isoform X2 [Frieseomelitta varia]|uniref:SET and MYND domain-containing protein 4-like isoform X2 n=1 Tax=Frieseomelitta varia TaxID=561572 RepID=UPI001CB6A45C|nr:SET and MYND domain-containing protein 4-like isoform X2 [Frieseomelitta varia]